jgi:hypothetical protein
VRRHERADGASYPTRASRRHDGYAGGPGGVELDGQWWFSSQTGMLIDLVLEREIEPGKVFDLTLPLADVADRGSLASRLMLRLWRPGSAGVFVVIHTISASRLYIYVIATRLVDISASSKMWLRVRRILGGSINFSVNRRCTVCRLERRSTHDRHGRNPGRSHLLVYRAR